MFSHENVKSNSLLLKLSKVLSSKLFWILSFALLTTLSAQVLVPASPVPFTLQTMMVLLAGAFLGSRNGMYSQLAYVSAGIGLPVYAGLTMGPAILFGPTGGYLLAFPFAAFITGFIIEKNNSLLSIIAAMTLGTLFILLSGALYLSLFFNGDISTSIFYGAVIFSVWDIIKISAAVSIYYAFSKKYPKLPVK
jgi:biotin transport system substrate-specific component